MTTPSQASAIVLGTGPLPDATAPEAWHQQYGSLFARNVTIATLTPFLPALDRSTGTAVIVAPGGGFKTLSMENEGSDVARALAERGIAAFVLKYRLNQTSQDMSAFERTMAATFASGAPRPIADPLAPFGNLAPQITDARAAIALVRHRAAEWHINPQRIGMIGFSAGAMLTMATTLANATDPHVVRPAFIGTIYGPLKAVSVPSDAPPLFIALSADDPFFGNDGFGLIDSWRAAHRPVELHLFEQGGHGFGMYPKPTTSTGWFDEYIRWLGMHNLLKAAE